MIGVDRELYHVIGLVLQLLNLVPEFEWGAEPVR